MKKCNIVNYANSLLYWLHDIILVEVIIKGRREIARIDCCISFYFPSAFPSHQTHLKRDRKTDWMINKVIPQKPKKKVFWPRSKGYVWTRGSSCFLEGKWFLKELGLGVKPRPVKWLIDSSTSWTGWFILVSETMVLMHKRLFEQESAGCLAWKLISSFIFICPVLCELISSHIILTEKYNSRCCLVALGFHNLNFYRGAFVPDIHSVQLSYFGIFTLVIHQYAYQEPYISSFTIPISTSSLGVYFSRVFLVICITSFCSQCQSVNWFYFLYQYQVKTREEFQWRNKMITGSRGLVQGWANYCCGFFVHFF